MAEIVSFIVGLLMLALPPGWSEKAPASCQTVNVLVGPPGGTTEECSATYVNGAQELTVIVWRPVVARDGGPMVSVEDFKGKLLGEDVMVSRTSQFLGQAQEVLTTAVTLKSPEAHVLIYAKGVSPEAFQTILDGVSVAP